MDRLNITNEMSALDRKDRKYFDDMTDEEKKKFSPYLMVRWGSSVQGSAELQAYYLMSANERLNKNFFDISASQHKKLLWLMATTVSPGMGVHKHQWIPPKKRESTSKVQKLIRQIRPELKDDEVELLASMNTKDELIAMAREYGWEEKKIKEILK